MLCKTRDHLKHALHGKAAEPHGDLDFTAWSSFSEVFCFGGKQRTECVRAKAALQISPPVLGYCGSAASLQQADSRMGPLLGDHVRWTGTRSGRAQSIKGTRCSSSVPAHSWPPLPQPKKRIFITRALHKDAQSCSLEAGSWRCESSAMLRAYKCPLTNLFFSIFRYQEFYFRKPNLTRGICWSHRRQTIVLRPWPLLLLPTQSQFRQISISHHRHPLPD